MISDVLHDAIIEIEEYQKTSPEMYAGFEQQIAAVKKSMNDLRVQMDRLPEEAIQEMMQSTFDRYKVKLRERDTVVTHDAYERSYTVPPLQFALFEAFCKADYIARMVSMNMRGDPGLTKCALHYSSTIFGPYDIEAPWIEDDWGEDKRREATLDQHALRKAMDGMTVIDVKTNENADLYYAILD